MLFVRCSLQRLVFGGRVLTDFVHSCAIGINTPWSVNVTPRSAKTLAMASKVKTRGSRAPASKCTMVRITTRQRMASSPWLKPRPARAALHCFPLIKVFPATHYVHLSDCALNAHYRGRNVKPSARARGQSEFGPNCSGGIGIMTASSVNTTPRSAKTCAIESRVSSRGVRRPSSKSTRVRIAILADLAKSSCWMPRPRRAILHMTPVNIQNPYCRL
ncbi:hypothetical protein LOKVESSMR4R_03876 [Yoonia vestfoldensis]|uniref:Uncharacterized protein n=1 Tax=Yoonia vestfoldensis TaxID=245188 RepID=A0A1Y0EI89_9RHOB|nr:hypothetical protein LOKVESSMR4R_03876 [Yoonia vestfoldensis]